MAQLKRLSDTMFLLARRFQPILCIPTSWTGFRVFSFAATRGYIMVQNINWKLPKNVLVEVIDDMDVSRMF